MARYLHLEPYLRRAGAGTARHDGCLGAGTGAIWPLWADRSKLIRWCSHCWHESCRRR